LLTGVAAALCVSVAAVSISELEASGLLGGLYFLLRFALLVPGLRYMARTGPVAAAATGVVVGDTIYYAVDALVSIYGRSRFLTWLELIAVAAFIALLVLRSRPLPPLPRGLRLAPLGSRPLAFAVLGGLVVWFILQFVGVEFGDSERFTLIEAAGPLGGLLPLITIGAACLAVAFASLDDESYPIFAAAAVAAYFVPEVLLLIGSLALGDQFAYLGNGIYLNTASVPWFTVMQAAVAAALTAGTALIARGQRGLRR
jgi:hypothetical protein